MARCRPRFRSAALTLALASALTGAVSHAADAPPKPDLTITRISSPITVDGDLSDAAWQGVPAIERWFETNPGDNVEPKVKTVGYLAYDDHYFYAAFRCSDPNPHSIRAPIGDHDAVPGSTDYAGVIVDSRNDGKTAQMFLANPHGVQYDAITSDATGEDNAPDFFWDSAGHTGTDGWTLEIRIPFSSLRYASSEQPLWRILLYRNYPRDRRYQFFSERLPKDVNCFVCNADRLVGLANLPHGSHFVLAPYATAQRQSMPSSGLGSGIEADDVKYDQGLDLKWSPASSVAVDATLNPDFSQVESDAAQIVANERFALFFPEKRPFFLEGVDLLAMPMQALYTRTINNPDAGMRATGKIGQTAYTAVYARDAGGGLVVLPGPEFSDYGLQDYWSNVGIMRFRRDIGGSFVSLFATGRWIDESGSNVVVGPDFQWRPKGSDAITSQYLYSVKNTPNRPDLGVFEWDGRKLQGHASQTGWSHSSRTWDWYIQHQDLSDDFRNDNGFIYQVGYREIYVGGGYTIRPKQSFLSRLRFWTDNYWDVENDGTPLARHIADGVGMDGRWNSFCRIELNHDEFRVPTVDTTGTINGGLFLERFRPRIQLQANPGRIVNALSLDTYFGGEIDFDNAREAKGVTTTASATIRPNDHLELKADASRRWIDVDEAGIKGRLFTAQVERLRTTWSFSSRAFVRLIGQLERTDSHPERYTIPVAFRPRPRSQRFTGTALVAYKLNWQTVFYAGYGDERRYLRATDRLEKGGNQVFAKISYALQR